MEILKFVIDVVCVGGIFAFYLLSREHIKKTDDFSNGRYKASWILNLIPMLIAIDAARYPIKVSWIPMLNAYGYRLVLWVIVLLIVVRFLWGIFLLADHQILFLQGTLGKVNQSEDTKVSALYSALKAIQSATLTLHDPSKREAYRDIKMTPNTPENELFAYASESFLSDFVVNYGNNQFDYFIWDESELNRDIHAVEKPYRHAVRYVLKHKDTYHIGGKNTNATGVALYSQYGFIVLISRHKNSNVDPNHILGMWTQFEYFWDSLNG